MTNLWSDYTGLLGQASCSVRLSSTCATRLSFSESGWIFCSIHSVVLALSATKNIFTFSHKISTISWFSPIKCGSTLLAWMLSSLTADGRYMEDFMISFTRQGEEKWCLRFRWTRRYCRYKCVNCRYKSVCRYEVTWRSRRTSRQSCPSRLSGASQPVDIVDNICRYL